MTTIIAPTNGLIVGECRSAMRSLQPGIAQTIITSPPYWGLRDYDLPPTHWDDGWYGCLGLEPTPDQFVVHLVEVFRECRRILRDDGTLWLNLGDSYATGAGSSKNPGSQAMPRDGNEGKHGYINGYPSSQANRMPLPGLKPGDLCNIPHRVSAAIQADGWFWRSTIIWHKRSPMPEPISGWRWVRCRIKVAGTGWTKETHPAYQDVDSGKMKSIAYGTAGGTVAREGSAKWEPCPGCPKCEPNGGYVLRRGKWRPTTAHEYVFLFSKSEKYFCDGDAVQEIAACAGLDRASKVRGEFNGKNILPGKEAFRAITETRNPRSVWTLSSEPYKGAHFATFPSTLARKCIEAGTSAGGCCPECEAPYAPVVASARVPTRPGGGSKATGDRMNDGNRDPQRHIALTRLTGYRPTCRCLCDQCAGTMTGDGCAACKPIGCLVFDPFAGSGTTLQSARALGRRYLGTEQSEAYAALAAERIPKPPRWASQRSKRNRNPSKRDKQRLLFSEVES